MLLARVISLAVWICEPGCSVLRSEAKERHFKKWVELEGNLGLQKSILKMGEAVDMP